MKNRTPRELEIIDFIEKLKPQFIKAVKNHVNSKYHSESVQITNESVGESSYSVEINNNLLIHISIDVDTDKRIGNGYESDDDCDF